MQNSLQQDYVKGQLISVEISDAAEVEKCFGRLENGVAVFVRGPVAVGDLVEAEVYKIKKRFLEARLVRVLEPASHRVDPPCTVFGICGGCKWQHISYEEQLRLKKKLVSDALEHLGGFADVPVHETLPGLDPYGYRNKVDFSFSDKRFLLPEEVGSSPVRQENFALGFHAPLRYAKVIDIEECHLATPAMNQILSLIRQFALERALTAHSTKTHEGYLRHLVIRESHSSGAVMVNLVTQTYEESIMQALGEALVDSLAPREVTLVNNITTRQSQVAFGEEEKVVVGTGVITESLLGLTFSISANSFFQTNTRQAEVLVKEVLKAAQLAPEDVVYDLYSGTGSFSLTMASICHAVLGVEVIENAVVDAQSNAVQNGISNCLFRQLDMKDFQKKLPELKMWGEPRVVVTDPPRAGMHPKAVRGLCELGAERVIFVSCKPASLARDARILCEEGPYRLTEVTPIDMFPQTAHIEVIAVLERDPARCG